MGFVVLRTGSQTIWRGLLLLCWCSVLGLGLSCAAVIPAPTVEHRAMRIPKGSLTKIAVLAFQPTASLMRAQTGRADSAESIADQVARLVTEQLMKRGFHVIGSSDLQTAIAAQGVAGGRADRRIAARVAARDFGATAILFGDVSRWRERGGERYGSANPASVAFNLGLYSAPEMNRLWTSKFDETQRPLSEHVLNARRYPGGGSRWLTASELAQWGVKAAVDTIPASM
ncbi:MAG: hypothetical protein AAEJ52_00590 [Myxococcota bacterium]